MKIRQSVLLTFFFKGQEPCGKEERGVGGEFERVQKRVFVQLDILIRI
jgi:hypothetical protein